MKLAKPEDLQVLERILHQRLQTEFSQADLFKVGCAIGDDGALVILSQHPPQVNLDADKTFTAIEQALQSLRPQAVQSVRLYLRKAGQKQIYAKHEIDLEPVGFSTNGVMSSSVPLTLEQPTSLAETESSPPAIEDAVEQPFADSHAVTETPAPTTAEQLESPPSDVTQTAEPEQLESPPSDAIETPIETPVKLESETATTKPEQLEPVASDINSFAGDRHTVTETPTPELSPPTAETEQLPLPTPGVAPYLKETTITAPEETWRSLPFEQRLETVGKSEPETPAETTTQTNTATLPYPVAPLQRLPQPAKNKIPRNALIAGSGVVIAALLGGVYVLSSPCTVGRCQQLETAKQLHQESNRIVQGAKEQAELIDAEKQLRDANNLLRQIPPWSSRYQAAQTLSGTINSKATILDRATAAIAEGDTAANKLRQPIRSLEDWRAIQALWQRAIASLSAIPQGNNLYPLAQRKITEYRGSLQAIEQQMQAERQAFQKLPQAQSLAQTAEKQQLTARSLQAWQTVLANWQNAVNNLSSIPQSSTAHQQAQQLLSQYRPQLKTASDRVAKEATSAKAFSQAMNSAELAERSEQQRQFTAAQTNWRQALIFAQQIPSGTQYYDQARSLIDTYTTKIEQAGSQLQSVNLTQTTRADLDRACSGKIRVCRYKLDNRQIFVQLTPSYEQAVEKRFIDARLRGDSQTQAEIATQYRTLKQVLEVISNNTRLPLQIYASDGGRMHSYKPKQ